MKMITDISLVIAVISVILSVLTIIEKHKRD